MELYPLKFEPIFHYRIWGGNKLKSILNKNTSFDNIGESWEISGVKDNVSIVKSGPLKGLSLKDLLLSFKHQLVGNKIYNKFGNDFPILIKFIDAQSPLSIQVHPNDQLAKKYHNSFGKNEMWYVMQAEENSKLLIGFNKKTSKEEYLSHLNNDSLTEIINSEYVIEGDVFNIPTGRVHAIGAGVLLAEIQQTSDVTYRIYDYNRIDNFTGKKRKLHNDLALEAIDFEFKTSYKEKYINDKNYSIELVNTPNFITNKILLSKDITRDYSNFDSFIIYICVKGNLKVHYKNKDYNLYEGETLLIPATIKLLSLKSENAELLEVYL